MKGAWFKRGVLFKGIKSLYFVDVVLMFSFDRFVTLLGFTLDG